MQACLSRRPGWHLVRVDVFPGGLLLAFPRHAAIANSSPLTRQERSLGRCRRRAESDPTQTCRDRYSISSSVHYCTLSSSVRFWLLNENAVACTSCVEHGKCNAFSA